MLHLVLLLTAGRDSERQGAQHLPADMPRVVNALAEVMAGMRRENAPEMRKPLDGREQSGRPVGLTERGGGAVAGPGRRAAVRLFR